MAPVIDTQLNEGVIYEATKDIFTGQHAEMRDRGAVRALINHQSRTGTLMLRVVNKHGFDAVSEAVLKLLSDKVYESKVIACQRFPDLFKPSTPQSAPRTELGGAVTTTEQAMLNGIKEPELDDTQDAREPQEQPTAINDAINSSASDISGSSSLFSIHLPFPTEHVLMEKLQKTLELACYQYGMRELQSTMQKRDWDCPEAAELNQWTELLGQKGNLKQEGFSKPLKELLQSIAQIRHTAVHRVRTDSSGLQRFLADAEELARALGDDICTETISKLRLDTQSTITELRENKQCLKMQLDEAQEEISKRRTELDQQEQENLRHMESEDKRYCALAGEMLQKALNLIGSLAIAPETGHAVLNGDRDVVSNDGHLGHEEHFEDCVESLH
ncbi:uncharacterized protein FSUBG_13351 [Fusarium subglutinans]|uniref:Uncharacterized protein n=1 Tax=Gibberella subglutinans TaxID=42677 RepID=A0A8H5KY30_GIBSU|nr:uncharacterized protein FSUBG_13351 [Fusarium subglutinans]KAF5580591.1 hypothetical protein FSUBG_13351 [Fusarium subglutinans]